MKVSDDDAWRQYRRGQAAMWIIFVSIIPAEMFIAPLLSKVWRPSTDSIVIVFIVWAVGLLSASSYVGFWSCPRCHNPFHLKGWRGRLFARKCLHCGLPKYSSGS